MNNSSLTTRTPRQSNFELLRIIAMLMIVASHWGWGMYGVNPQGSDNIYFYHMFRAFGQVGVNIFIFISGYFLVKSRFKISTVLRLCLEAVFYSLALIFANMIFELNTDLSYNFATFFKAVFFLFGGGYWFINAYIVFYLIHPFLNLLISKISQSQLLFLLCFMLSVTVIFPTLYPSFFPISGTTCNLVFFVTVYFFGAYIRLYPESFENIFVIIGGLLISGSIYFCSVLVPIKYNASSYNFQYKYNVCLFTFSLFIFLLFRKIKLGEIKIINLISSTTFGVYLLHENTIVRKTIWNDIFKIDELYKTDKFVSVSLLSVAVVFLCCSAIDLVRIYLLERPLFRLLDKRLSRFYQNAESLLPQRPIYETVSRKIPAFYLHYFVIFAVTIFSYSAEKAKLFDGMSAISLFCIGTAVFYFIWFASRAAFRKLKKQSIKHSVL